MKTLPEILNIALWLAGIAHFCILGASFQVPFRLNWKEDLAKLTSFNRKLMWNYGAFVVGLIISFGTLTFVLHAELLRGDRAAIGLASLIGIFWGARLLVDLFYFKHSDWPQGPGMVVGHALLMSTFAALTTTYLGLVLWHLTKGLA
jgi:hypothetical protein